jgi:replication fork clamp-binding protein CrfC
MAYVAIQFDKDIQFKKNGGQLQDIEVSQEQSVLPDGALHKNKHNLELEHVTHKGVPVITVDGDAETFDDIKAQEDSITQHAEVEALEVIFSKELTDFIEEKRKEWHKSGSNEILEEVGKRVTKELLENTKDTTGMIESMEGRV